MAPGTSLAQQKMATAVGAVCPACPSKKGRFFCVTVYLKQDAYVYLSNKYLISCMSAYFHEYDPVRERLKRCLIRDSRHRKY